MLELIKGDQIVLNFEDLDEDHTKTNSVLVSLENFHGIEINDFACCVARTALWIAEKQADLKTDRILKRVYQAFPLKDYETITHANSLQIDWNDVVPSSSVNYIIGNPPFIGKKYQTKQQKKDLINIFGSNYKGVGSLDYVCGWFKKASNFIDGTDIKVAFVSTNSIVQGEMVAFLWKSLINEGIYINYAYKSFIWESEADSKAHVYCVIIGFSKVKKRINHIFNSDGSVDTVSKVNPYLYEGDSCFLEKRKNPLCDVLPMIAANKPCDYNNLKIEGKDYSEFVAQDPKSKKWIKQMVGAEEFIKNKARYCLWLVDCSPSELLQMPLVLDRVRRCREARIKANTNESLKLAETPTLFREQINPDSYLLVPCVSSEKRRYVPIGFYDSNVIPVMGTLIIPDAPLYYFGILTSNVHNAWMRVIAGRLKSDYRYSNTLVYNNFIWPSPSHEQKARIEKYAQEILDARLKYTNCSLADMYNPDNEYLFPDLFRAHDSLDRAVETTYGFKANEDEKEIVKHLFSLYEQKVSK